MFQQGMRGVGGGMRWPIGMIKMLRGARGRNSAEKKFEGIQCLAARVFWGGGEKTQVSPRGGNEMFGGNVWRIVVVRKLLEIARQMGALGRFIRDFPFNYGEGLFLDR